MEFDLELDNRKVFGEGNKATSIVKFDTYFLYSEITNVIPQPFNEIKFDYFLPYIPAYKSTRRISRVLNFGPKIMTLRCIRRISRIPFLGMNHFFL